jgi:hypothetical protein
MRRAVILALTLVLSGCTTAEEWQNRYKQKFELFVATDQEAMVSEIKKAGSELPKIATYQWKTPTIKHCGSDPFNLLSRAGPEISRACFKSLQGKNVAAIQMEALRGAGSSPEYEMEISTTISNHDRKVGFTEFVATVSVETEFSTRDHSFSIKGMGSKTISDDEYVNAFGLEPKAITAYELALKSAFYQSVVDAIPRVSRNLEKYKIGRKGDEGRSPATTPTLGLEGAKEKCADLGFKVGTEKFGECVLKLSE